MIGKAHDCYFIWRQDGWHRFTTHTYSKPGNPLVESLVVVVVEVVVVAVALVSPPLPVVPSSLRGTRKRSYLINREAGLALSSVIRRLQRSTRVSLLRITLLQLPMLSSELRLDQLVDMRPRRR